MVEGGVLIAGAAGAVLALWGLVRAEHQPVFWGLLVAAASLADRIGIVDLSAPVHIALGALA
ncbi:hypothetical protein SZN_06881 [Streptomyces zinciresistens K42]|uniref:Uncharacterized protein n=1 Tax=Streptomyces zinciresistens K42 TaxID=700597 RepID=G2G7B4_9ACTN|nr:hypothetical protein SZN_06881 [Streptomyces zinciresistens K42]